MLGTTTYTQERTRKCLRSEKHFPLFTCETQGRKVTGTATPKLRFNRMGSSPHQNLHLNSLLIVQNVYWGFKMHEVKLSGTKYWSAYICLQCTAKPPGNTLGVWQCHFLDWQITGEAGTFVRCLPWTTQGTMYRSSLGAITYQKHSPP